MSEFKGNPGPWLVQDEFEEGKIYHVDSPQIYIWDGDEQSHKPICDLGAMGIMNYAQEIANAQLIAAAPELLEALQGLVADIANKPNDTRYATHVKIAKAAIAKALGQV